MKSNLHVLVVEDEQLIGKEIETNLLSFGYTVIGVVSAAATAIKKAKDERPDIVIMDIRLPGGMDGIAAAAEIRKSLDIPVVFLTAYADEPTLARAAAAEPFGFVLKPFIPQQLYAAIVVSMARYRAERRLKSDLQGFSAGAPGIEAVAPLLAICATCKRIREEADSWQTVEEFITRRLRTTLTHGICPECAQRLYPEIFNRRPGG